MFNVKEELENQEKEIARLTRANVLLEKDNTKLTKQLRKARKTILTSNSDVQYIRKLKFYSNQLTTK